MPKQKGYKRKAAAGGSSGAAFTKQRSKIGRVVQKSNTTDTTVTAATLRVQSQSVVAQRDEQVTWRGQNLGTLVSQSRHHNDGTRRDAMEGLRELLTRHCDWVSNHLSMLMDALCERVDDSDTAVRGACRRLCATVMEQLNAAIVLPYLPSLVAHVCAALSSQVLLIAVDALKLLDVIVRSCPTASVVALQRALPHIAGAFCDGKSGTEMRLRPASVKWRLEVLKCTLNLLKVGQQSVSEANTQGASETAWSNERGASLCVHRRLQTKSLACDGLANPGHKSSVVSAMSAFATSTAVPVADIVVEAVDVFRDAKGRSNAVALVTTAAQLLALLSSIVGMSVNVKERLLPLFPLPGEEVMTANLGIAEVLLCVDSNGYDETLLTFIVSCVESGDDGALPLVLRLVGSDEALTRVLEALQKSMRSCRWSSPRRLKLLRFVLDIMSRLPGPLRTMFADDMPQAAWILGPRDHDTAIRVFHAMREVVVSTAWDPFDHGFSMFFTGARQAFGRCNCDVQQAALNVAVLAPCPQKSLKDAASALLLPGVKPDIASFLIETVETLHAQSAPEAYFDTMLQLSVGNLSTAIAVAKSLKRSSLCGSVSQHWRQKFLEGFLAVDVESAGCYLPVFAAVGVGHAVDDASAASIVDRVVQVLAQGNSSQTVIEALSALLCSWPQLPQLLLDAVTGAVAAGSTDKTGALLQSLCDLTKPDRAGAQIAACKKAVQSLRVTLDKLGNPGLKENFEAALQFTEKLQ